MGNSTTAATVVDPDTMDPWPSWSGSGSLLLIEYLKNLRKKFNIFIIFNKLPLSLVRYLLEAIFFQWPQKSHRRIRIRPDPKLIGLPDTDPNTGLRIRGSSKNIQ
jgi:hypothetical protein